MELISAVDGSSGFSVSRWQGFEMRSARVEIGLPEIFERGDL